MSAMNIYGDGPIFEEGISQVTATPSVGLGARRLHQGEEYVYCYNAGGAQASVQLGVRIITGASGYSVAQTSSADVFNPCVGVVKHSTFAAGDYGWIMTKGFATVKFSTARSAGVNYLMIALGVGGIFIEASGTTTMGTATVIGHAIGTPAPDASGTAYAFIKTGY